MDISRREFIVQLSMLASAAAAYPSQALAAKRNKNKAGLPDWAQLDPWRTLAAVQEHLFPAGDDVPGAVDIQAIQYLRNAMELSQMEQSEKTFIIKGVGWLNELIDPESKRHFAFLDQQQKEQALRKIEASNAGYRWLSKLLTYLIEALLADPVYGGNPNGVGWRWLEHQAGFPLPGGDQQWHKLGYAVYFQRKADG